MMRALGYPRLISLDNFRTPNFELVADVLYWMVKRYDPDLNISDNIESENDRVEFLTVIAEAMQTKAHIKLNSKKLYTADGHAVKELLKLATLLYSANRVEDDDDGDDNHGVPEFGGEDNTEPSLTSQVGDVKKARALATEITETGARLYDLLGKEAEARPQRLRAVAFLEAVSANLGSTRESEIIDSGGREIIARSRENIAALRQQCEDLEADEAELNAKIKKKKSDLERGEKRLKSLQAHRPAFADELEKLEGELRRYYEVYMDRFRNLDFLEYDMDCFHQSEMEELEEYERKRNRNAERIRREQLKQFIGREPENESAIEEELLRKQYPGFDGSIARGPLSSAGGGGGSRGGSRGRGAGGSSRGGVGSAGGGGGLSSADRGGRTAGKGERAARGGGGGKVGLKMRRSKASTSTHGSGSKNPDRSASASGESSSEMSGSDLNRSAGGTSSDEEVSLNDSDDTGSLIDEDDESSEDRGSRSDSDSNDENF
ncbi:unnamed protein product [Ascophyllum nodosum]